MIMGAPGSGKSTLAFAMSGKLGLPIIHMDHFYYAPDWVQRPDDETTRMVLSAIEAPEWIFEGNHSRTAPARMEKADLVVFIDFPTWLVLIRVIWRAVRDYGKTRPDHPPGCKESVDLAFWGDTLRWNRLGRPKRLRMLAEAHARGIETAHLTSPAAVKAFLDRLPEERTN